MVQTILTFIIIFSILVIIHEFGHFYFAKRAGILVREFAIGMGPKIFSARKNGTTYTIRILPLGGYVRMAGYGDDEAEMRPGMPLKIVLNENDEVTHIDLSEKEHLHAIPMELTAFDLDREMYIEGMIPGKDMPIRYVVKRDALIIEPDETEVQVAPIDVQFQSASLGNRMLTNFAGPMNNFILGIIVFSLLAFLQGGIAVNENRLGEIQPDGPAEIAGLQEGDIILEINDESMETWTDVMTTIQGLPNQEIKLTVQPKGEESITNVTAMTTSQTTEEGQEVGLLGVYQPVDHSFQAKILYGFSQTWFIITSIFGLIASMFTNGFDINSFGGPVAIYAATEEVVSYGFYSILSFLGFLSVNLGTVNLLPIPALDGGKILLNIIEGVRGKPLEPEKEGIITVIGVGLLFILMILVTWNDIQRFFFG